MEKHTIKNKTNKSWGKNLHNVLFRMQRLHSQLYVTTNKNDK